MKGVVKKKAALKEQPEKIYWRRDKCDKKSA